MKINMKANGSSYGFYKPAMALIWICLSLGTVVSQFSASTQYSGVTNLAFYNSYL